MWVSAVLVLQQIECFRKVIKTLYFSDHDLASQFIAQSFSFFSLSLPQQLEAAFHHRMNGSHHGSSRRISFFITASDDFSDYYMLLVINNHSLVQ